MQEKLKAAFTKLEEMSAKRDEEGGGVNTLFEQKKALHEEVRKAEAGRQAGWQVDPLDGMHGMNHGVSLRLGRLGFLVFDWGGC